MGQSQQIQSQEEELELNSIQDLYKSFIMECPSGSLYLHEFKRMFGVQNGTPESQYMDNIFRAFDMNHVRHDFEVDCPLCESSSNMCNDSLKMILVFLWVFFHVSTKHVW